MQLTLNDALWAELLKIIKLHAHARSAKQIGNPDESKAYRQKADKLAIKWARRLRRKQ
jgi:hypothetical protein